MNRTTARALARATGDRAVRVRRLPPADPDVRRGRRGDRRRSRSSTRIERLEGAPRDRARLAADRVGLHRARRALRRDLPRADRRRTFPTDPREQLAAARQRRLRVLERAARAGVPARVPTSPDDLGTAVNVMEMVFGNRDARSATGVCFSRIPATGEPGLFGEFLVDAQGEDVVAGTRTPEPIARMRERFPTRTTSSKHAVARARAPLPRHAGRRVHGRARPALPPADARGEAHCRRRAARSRGVRRRGADRPARGGAANRPSRARAAAPSDDRSDAPPSTSRPSGLRLTRRGARRRRVRRRRRAAARRQART